MVIVRMYSKSNNEVNRRGERSNRKGKRVEAEGHNTGEATMTNERKFQCDVCERFFIIGSPGSEVPFCSEQCRDTFPWLFRTREDDYSREFEERRAALMAMVRQSNHGGSGKVN
jgi:hypothetical protein